ncbi:MAG: glycosyltransferase family 4 protein [Pirellulaceae bacterium]
MDEVFALVVPYRLYLAAVGVALLASLLLTPVMRRMAFWLDIVDHPDEHRKLHARATPLGGGVAVLAAFALSVTTVAFWSMSQREVFASDARFVFGLAAASLIICAVGLLDDRFHLRGRQKLVGQIVAGVVLIASGLCIERITVLDVTINLGIASIPFTLFWLLGAINALNLIDGVDGLATGVGVVLSLSIAAIADALGHRTEAFLALAMAGALIGFLAYNRSPASIFLGDAGSMLIGLVVGTLAIRGSFKGPATAVLSAPIASWAIPILDVTMAILRRRLTGRSIYIADRGHLHHTLLKRGYTSGVTASLIGLLCILTGLGAVASVVWNSEWYAFGAIAVVVATLIVTRVYGHHESRLLGQRVKHLAWSLLPSVRGPEARMRELRARLEGNQQWEELWETLTEFAERFDVNSIQLNIMLPAHGEEFHASWERKGRPDDHELWHCDIPLIAHDVTVGRLKITGVCNAGSVCTWMSDLIAGLKPFESHLLELISECFDLPLPVSAERVSSVETAADTATYALRRLTATQLPGR